MGIVLDPNSSKQVIVLAQEEVSKCVHEFPKFFGRDLGTLKTFVRKIVLKKEAIPVAHKVRSVPLALRSSLKEELHRLTKSNRIEAIESSVVKSNGNSVNPMARSGSPLTLDRSILK